MATTVFEKPMGAEVEALKGQIGTLSSLTTTAKNNVVSAVNEVNGKIGTLNNVYSGSSVVSLDELFENIKTFTNNMNNNDVKTAGFSASSSADSTIFTQGGQYAGHISKYSNGNWTGFFTNNVGETIAVGTYNNGNAKWYTSSRELNDQLKNRASIKLFTSEEITINANSKKDFTIPVDAILNGRNIAGIIFLDYSGNVTINICKYTTYQNNAYISVYNPTNDAITTTFTIKALYL